MNTMTTLSLAVFIICAYAGTSNVIYFVKNHSEPKSIYILTKGIIVYYLGAMYGIIWIDRFIIDIVNYPAVETAATTQLLRMAAFLSACIFAADSFVRGK